MKWGFSRSTLRVFYIFGLLLSLTLSYVSYQKQTEGLSEVQVHLKSLETLELWQELYSLQQRKINAFTLSLLKNESALQDNLGPYRRDMELKLGQIKGPEALELLKSLKQERKLEKGKAKSTKWLPLFKKQSLLINQAQKNFKKESLRQREELIGASKSWLQVLTYYSYGMSAIFALFLFGLSMNKKSLQRLEAERKKRDFMLDAVDGHIFLFNKDFELIAANEMVKTFWKGLGDLQGLPMEILFPLVVVENNQGGYDEYKFSESPLKEKLSEDLTHIGYRLELGLRLKATHITWFQVSLKSYKNELYLISFVDITSLIEAKNLIQKQQETLIEQSKMTALGQMSGGMAHEINNPLAIISSEAEELLEIAEEEGTVGRDDAQSISGNIKKTTDRIAQIIKGLRIFARQEGKDEKVAVPLKEVIDEVLMMASERFKSKGVEFHTVLPQDDKGRVYANEVQLIQVLVNLLNNAFDATKEQKQRVIEFHWRILPQDNLIIIKDNGPGIGENLRKKIFDPFFTTKKVGEGTGLGLSLSRSIVEDHGGSLILESSSHEGAEFVIKLPHYTEDSSDEDQKEEDKWAS